MTVVFLGGGIVFLWLGGEAFVRGSVAVASRLNVSQLMIGLTLVGFGTSLPELVTSLTAALNGAPGLSVGNVVGSNIANVLLILGVAAAIRPVTCNPNAFYRDAFALGAATAIGTALVWFGYIGRGSGILLVGGIIAYLALVFRHERRQPGPAARVFEHEAEAVDPALDSLPLATGLVVVGLAGVIGGAWLIVSGAIELATLLGVSKTFIGLTIVAVGTSLPELVIGGVASLRGRSDVALGSVMGSNMFNTLAILGITAVVTPIEVPPELGSFDLGIMVAATAVLLTTAATKLSITRWEGMLFVIAYAGYMAVRSTIAMS